MCVIPTRWTVVNEAILSQGGKPLPSRIKTPQTTNSRTPSRGNFSVRSPQSLSNAWAFQWKKPECVVQRDHANIFWCRREMGTAWSHPENLAARLLKVAIKTGQIPPGKAWTTWCPFKCLNHFIGPGSPGGPRGIVGFSIHPRECFQHTKPLGFGEIEYNVNSMSNSNNSNKWPIICLFMVIRGYSEMEFIGIHRIDHNKYQQKCHTPKPFLPLAKADQVRGAKHWDNDNWPWAGRIFQDGCYGKWMKMAQLWMNVLNHLLTLWSVLGLYPIISDSDIAPYSPI